MRRFLKAGAVALALFVTCVLGYVGYVRANDNFHVVQAGVVYRAWQPDGDEIAAFAREIGRGSVINLRGAAPGRDWYEEERRAAEQNGLAHFDFKMSATKPLSFERARMLVDLMASAPKPLLIHCKAGADRAGLASALYLYAVADQSADQAIRQLSLIYGHFPYLGSRTVAMAKSFDAFVRVGAAPRHDEVDLATR